MIKVTAILTDETEQPALLDPTSVSYIYEGYYNGTVVVSHLCCFLCKESFTDILAAMPRGTTHTWIVHNNEGLQRAVTAWTAPNEITVVLNSDRKYKGYRCSWVYMKDGQRFLNTKHISSYDAC